MPFRMAVGLGPGHIALDGDPAPAPKGHSPPQFSVYVYCSQTAAHLSYYWPLVGTSHRTFNLCGHRLIGYQSTRHTVISSHGHVVTRSTRHQSTRHRHVSSYSQLVTSEHITKPLVPVVIIYTPSASGDIQKQCSTRTA